MISCCSMWYKDSRRKKSEGLPGGVGDVPHGGSLKKVAPKVAEQTRRSGAKARSKLRMSHSSGILKSCFVIVVTRPEEGQRRLEDLSVHLMGYSTNNGIRHALLEGLPPIHGSRSRHAIAEFH